MGKRTSMNGMKQDKEIKVLVDVLFEEYKSLTIPPEPTAKVVTRSEFSLKRDRDEGIGIPFTKVGKQTGSDKILYSIYDIASFVVSRKTKVAK